MNVAFSLFLTLLKNLGFSIKRFPKPQLWTETKSVIGSTWLGRLRTGERNRKKSACECVWVRVSACECVWVNICRNVIRRLFLVFFSYQWQSIFLKLVTFSLTLNPIEKSITQSFPLFWRTLLFPDKTYKVLETRTHALSLSLSHTHTYTQTHSLRNTISLSYSHTHTVSLRHTTALDRRSIFLLSLSLHFPSESEGERSKHRVRKRSDFLAQ